MALTGFNKKFRSGLAKWSGMNQMVNYGYSLANDVSEYVHELYEEEFIPRRYENEGRLDEWKQTAQLARSFVNALLIQELCRRTDGPGCVHNLLELVDSPIEAAYLLSLILCARNEFMQIEIRGQPAGSRFPVHACFAAPESDDSLLILPQAHIGDYRVDYLLRFTRIRRYGWNDKSCDDGSSKIAETIVERQIIVECDGHEFHERTKDQARRDKKRDRRLQALGFPVYRYTGSEIYESAIDCAVETMNALMSSCGDTPMQEARAEG